MRSQIVISLVSFAFSSAVLAATPESSASENGRYRCQPNASGSGWQCDAIEANSAQGTLYVPVTSRAASVTTVKKGKAPKPKGPYARLDWVDRNQLSEEDQASTPAYCAGAYVEPDYLAEELRDLDPATQPILGSSIQSETTEDGHSTLTGDVVVRQGYRQVKSNKALIDRNAGTVDLEGESTYREPGVLLIGQETHINLETKAVTIKDAEFVAHESHMRGTAQQLEKDENAIIRITKGMVTNCPPGTNSWTLASKHIELDREQGDGVAKHAVLKVKNVPVFYTPYIRFPIDDRRKSGFLFPQLGKSDDGIDFAAPYYFNLAPNYDATFTPRYISDRGAMSELEFRYLHKNNKGIIGGAYLDSDDEFNGNDRWLGSVEHSGSLFNRINTFIDYATVSDEDYFSDLGTDLNISSRTHLLRIGQASYTSDWWRVITRLHGYQTLDDAITDANKPYDRLPQILFEASYPLKNTGLEIGLKTEYSYFDRDNDNLTGLQSAVGSRMRAEPSVSWNLEWPFAYIKPTLKYKYSKYSLDDLDSSFDDSPDIATPLYSLDSGIFFERAMSLFGESMTQTFEPRLFYLKVPEEKDQHLIPNFDTGELTFSYNQLFREDRFTGGDRIGDADQLAVGLATRLIEASGFERFRASIGQIYYFEDRLVSLTGIPAIDATNSESAYAAEFSYALRSGWRFYGDIEWDPELERTNESSIGLRYHSNNQHIFNLGYRVRNDRQKLEQTDFSLIWPLSDRWQIFTRWNQDLIHDRIIEALAGIEYSSCCWSIRIAARRWINDDDLFLANEVEEKDGIYIQFQLKGLAGLGQSLEGILSNSIPGYREQRNNDFFNQ